MIVIEEEVVAVIEDLIVTVVMIVVVEGVEEVREEALGIAMDHLEMMKMMPDLGNVLVPRVDLVMLVDMAAIAIPGVMVIAILVDMAGEGDIDLIHLLLAKDQN